MKAGLISELSRNVICSGFEKSRVGPTRNRSALGWKVFSVRVPARVDANTTLPSGANAGSKLWTLTPAPPTVRPLSLVSWVQRPAATSSIQRSSPDEAPTRAANTTFVPS